MSSQQLMDLPNGQFATTSVIVDSSGVITSDTTGGYSFSNLKANATKM